MMRCGGRDWKLRRLWSWRRDEVFGVREGNGELSWGMVMIDDVAKYASFG